MLRRRGGGYEAAEDRGSLTTTAAGPRPSAWPTMMRAIHGPNADDVDARAVRDTYATLIRSPRAMPRTS